MAEAGYYWRLGRRYTRDVQWGVECGTCGVVKLGRWSRRESARWLEGHRAEFHALNVGPGAGGF